MGFFSANNNKEFVTHVRDCGPVFLGGVCTKSVYKFDEWNSYFADEFEPDHVAAEPVEKAVTKMLRSVFGIKNVQVTRNDNGSGEWSLDVTWQAGTILWFFRQNCFGFSLARENSKQFSVPGEDGLVFNSGPLYFLNTLNEKKECLSQASSLLNLLEAVYFRAQWPRWRHFGINN